MHGGIHENVTLVKSQYESFRTGDLQAVVDRLTENITWAVPGTNRISGNYQGPKQVVELLGKIMDITAGHFALEVDSIVADDDHAIALVRITARRDGQTLSYDAAQVWQLTAGKVTKFVEYLTDQATVDEIYRW
jgi:ketosteroid isomerase-like protein